MTRTATPPNDWIGYTILMSITIFKHHSAKARHGSIAVDGYCYRIAGRMQAGMPKCIGVATTSARPEFSSTLPRISLLSVMTQIASLITNESSGRGQGWTSRMKFCRKFDRSAPEDPREGPGLRLDDSRGEASTADVHRPKAVRDPRRTASGLWSFHCSGPLAGDSNPYFTGAPGQLVLAV